MAGRKQAVGVQDISAHTRQDAGISRYPQIFPFAIDFQIRNAIGMAGRPNPTSRFLPSSSKDFLGNADESQDSLEYVSGQSRPRSQNRPVQFVLRTVPAADRLRSRSKNFRD